LKEKGAENRTLVKYREEKRNLRIKGRVVGEKIGIKRRGNRKGAQKMKIHIRNR